MYNARYSLDFLKMISFVKHLFKLHIKSKSPQRLDLFRRFAVYNDMTVKLGVLLFFIGGLTFFIFPIYKYFFDNQLVPMMLIFIPGIDHSTTKGFIILSIIHCFLAALGIIALSSCDVFYALMICNVPIMGRLIEDEVNQLNQSLTDSESVESIYRFRNVLLMHQEISK